MTKSAGRLMAASLFIVAFAGSMAGCGSSRYTMVEPPSKTVTDYEVLEIKEFTSVLTDPDSKDLALRFAGQLHDAIIEERKKNPNQTVFKEVVRSTDRKERVLVLDGKVISFEKGSRAKRYFLGFGAGKAFCTIQATFTDKATGEEVVKANFDGELSMSFFGGSAEEAVDAVVKAFIDYFRDYFAEGTPPPA